MPAPRLRPDMLSGDRLVAVPEQDHALAPTAADRPEPKTRDTSKARVNMTYRTTEARQRALRRYAFEHDTTIQDLIDAALAHYLPSLKD